MIFIRLCLSTVLTAATIFCSRNDYNIYQKLSSHFDFELALAARIVKVWILAVT